jgi:hypothetical protein
MTISATATISTDQAERLARQLVTHLGRKVEWVEHDGVATSRFGPATGSVEATGRTLRLTATGATNEEVAGVEAVLASHLERFAFRHPVEISWVSGESGAVA